MVGATVATKSCLAVRGDSIFSLLRHMAAERPLVAASAMCFLNLSFVSMTTPKILASCFGLTSSPLIVNGVWLVRSATRVKCTMVVLSHSNVAPLRLSHASARSMMVCMPSLFASAVGPVTQAECSSTNAI